MAAEMVLIPLVRYERLLDMDKKEKGSTNKVKEEVDDDLEKVESFKPDPKHDESFNPDPKHDSEDIPEVLTQAKSDVGDSEKKRNPNKKSTSSESKEAPTLRGPPNQDVNKVEIDSLLNEIPSKYRGKAKKILAYIDLKGGSTINWNSRGRLIYKKMVINDSNIVELVHGLIVNKVKKVIGFNLFKKGLLKINMPDSLWLPAEKKKKKVNDTSSKDTMQSKWLKY